MENKEKEKQKKSEKKRQTEENRDRERDFVKKTSKPATHREKNFSKTKDVKICQNILCGINFDDAQLSRRHCT